MVESDGIGKSTSDESGAGEAAQALRAILQTQYLRYMIIGTWALGLLATAVGGLLLRLRKQRSTPRHLSPSPVA